MPSKCSVSSCRGNYDASNKVAVFGFPSDERLREKWLHAISRKDFNVTKNSKVCERHFKDDEVLRNTTFYVEKTGETLSAPMKRAKLKQNAVPSIFPDCPSFMSSSSSLHESPSQKQQCMKSSSGTEFQRDAETSITIKQEPDESVDEPPRLVIEKVFCAEELLSSSIISSSSTSSPSTSNIPLVPENTLPIANPDSTNVYQTPAPNISKRKLKPDAYDATLDATQDKLCRRDKLSLPSKRNSKRKMHPPSGTSNKSAGRSTSPTQNGEDTTREILQSLLDSSENNPLFGARSTERPGDLFDMFSDFIADKLRKMDSHNCAHTLRAILDLVFNACQVQHDSVERDISSSNTSSGSSDQE